MTKPLDFQLNHQPAPAVSPQLARRLSLVMIIDGGFLAVVGAVQVTIELVGHFFGAGPLAPVFDRSPYSLGWVEAHGLAALTGALFLLVGARDRRRYWHGYALAVHILLGGANLLFWSSFITFGAEPLGIGATVAHVGLAIAQAGSLIASRPR